MQAEYVTLSHFNKAIDEIKFILFEMNKKFITKEDAKSFATKEDLKQFATKEEVREIVKEEIYSLEDRLALSVAKVEDIERLEEKMTTMATKEELSDMEERLSFRYNRRLELLEDHARIVKTRLQLN